MKKKKVLLKLYSEFNLGDDLFLKIILERYPNVKFYLNADRRYKVVFKNKSNLSIFNSSKIVKLYNKGIWFLDKVLYPKDGQNSLVKYINAINKNYFNLTDIFVSIGGSIFMQEKLLPYYFDIEYYKQVNLFYKGKPKFYLGCNFGPFLDSTFKTEYECIFKKAIDVCFREEYSKKLFENLNNVRHKPDIVFGLKINKAKKIDRSVGFSIISPRRNIDTNKYLQKYAELISYYQANGYKIFLFSFCKKQGDEKTIKEIIKLLPKRDNINPVFYDGDIESFLKLYSSVEQGYCGRFHAMILSMLCNQTIYPVVYSDKMTNVLQDINYNGDVILMDNFHHLEPEYLFKSISLNSYSITNQIIEAEEQFQILDNCLFETIGLNGNHPEVYH
jgi:colanic acid/amylovoran biosynthesis protein